MLKIVFILSATGDTDTQSRREAKVKLIVWVEFEKDKLFTTRPGVNNWSKLVMKRLVARQQVF